MSGKGLATTPTPPYYAVIFTNQRRDDGDNGYGETADRMAELAATMPGFLGIESVRDADGFGITVSYWRDEAAIRNWRANAEHTAARERGRNEWYSDFELRVAKVERAYGMSKRATSAEETTA
ncbi:MAG: antibiotic biosynthesis monooxygenase [Proteobacteria bacterium]|nr:antibiotic biosynthesis monooxygenase [Pseudomonadota bacterium]